VKRYAESLGVTTNYILGETETELPDMKTPPKRMVQVWQALHKVEQRNPARFAELCRFIVALGEAKDKAS
jgi:hypothetical protein